MKNRSVRSFALLCVVILLMVNVPEQTSGQAAASNQGNRVYLPIVYHWDESAPTVRKVNFDFSPYVDGQDPNTGVQISEAQIRQRLGLIAPYSSWVRSFGCGSGLEVIGRVAHEMGLKVAAGAWLSGNTTTNQEQINCLIAQANAGHVDLAIVGSETLVRSDISVNTLIQYLDQVQAAIPASIPVATADVYSYFLDNPGLIEHVDVIMPNIYPFWEGYPIQNAVAVVNYWYQKLAETYPSKPVYISETGWPSCGSYHDSLGSPANQAAFFNQIVSWSRDKNVFLFYFDALDESWKAREEGEQGACWGVFDKQGKLKSGMDPVFSGVYTPYTTQLPPTCGASSYSFQFTSVPPIGSDENVKGKTCGVVNLDYNIVLYIKVGGTWWIKPYSNSPYTAIAPDGSWEIDYTTGGIDEQATVLRAYLLPKGVIANSDISRLSAYPYIEAAR